MTKTIARATRTTLAPEATPDDTPTKRGTALAALPAAETLGQPSPERAHSEAFSRRSQLLAKAPVLGPSAAEAKVEAHKSRVMAAVKDRVQHRLRDSGQAFQAAAGLFLHAKYRELSKADKSAPAEQMKEVIAFVVDKLGDRYGGALKALGGPLKALGKQAAEHLLANFHAITEHALAMTGSVINGGEALVKAPLPDLHPLVNHLTEATVDDPNWPAKSSAAVDALFPVVDKAEVLVKLLEGHITHKDKLSPYGFVRRHGPTVYARETDPQALRHAEARVEADRILGGAR